MKTKLMIGLALGIIFLGSGCSWFKSEIAKIPSLSSIPKMVPAGPKPANFDGASPAEAAKKINFVPGSQFEIRQTYLGLGAKLADALSGGSKEGVRIVTLERFAPMVYSDVSWKLSNKIETAASQKAREDYEAKKANSPIGQAVTDTPPETVTEMQTVEGGLLGIDLKKSHNLYPPAYWPSQKINALDSSAIWLSKDVFDELTKTRETTLYYGLTDEKLFGAMKSAKDFADAISALKQQADQAGKGTDLDLTKADADFADWTLKVNGQDVKVQVFKARNWFGEIVVLNNPQNPLILKMTFNPLAMGAANILKGNALLPSLLGYEVTQLDNVQ